MCGKFYLVVGDIYSEFATNDNVITASKLIEALRDAWRWVGDERIVIGQGVGESERVEILKMLKKRCIRDVSTHNKLTPLHVTHKRSADNVLIADPKKLRARHYEYSLVVNDKSDRLVDHVTGQHLAGMLLIEAARQAMIASLEYEYIQKSGKNIALILERFDTRFMSYVYPQPTILMVEVKERDVTSDNNLSVTVIVEFLQLGQTMCEMQLDLTLKDVAKLTKFEARRAKSAVSALMKESSPFPIQADIAI